MLNLKIFNSWNFVKILIYANALKKASYLQQKVFNSVCDKIVLFHFYIWTEYISSMNSKRFWTERGMRTGMLWEMPGWFYNSDA